MSINKDLYEYYREQGIPYEGDVENVGYAYREFMSIECPSNARNTEFFSLVYTENILIENEEPVKYIDENGNKVIESNVVVLVKQQKSTPINATEKQITKISKQNTRIERKNNDWIEDVTEKLNKVYNGADGKGTKNSAGETVKFIFNIIRVTTHPLPCK